MILLVHFDDYEMLSKFIGYQWFYLGDKEDQIPYLEEKLGRPLRYPIGQKIDQIVNSLRDNFVDYIGQLSQLQTDKILWYSSRMASKSVSQTSIFHHYIYVKLIEELSRQDLVCITERRDLFRVIDSLKLLHVEIVSDSKLYNLAPQLNRENPQSQWFMQQYDAFSHLRNNEVLNRSNVLLYSWIDDRVFDNPPSFYDSYFRNLENELHSHGYTVGRLLPPFFTNLDQLMISKLQKLFKNLIYPFAYIDKDDLKQLLQTNFYIKLDTIQNIKDLNILTALTIEEVKKENETKRFQDYLIAYYSFMGVKKYLPKQTAIIYPFENQPWEKMLNLALPDHYKIAYQHTTIPGNWLDYRISRYEVNCPAPNIIFTIGKTWTNFLKQYYRYTKIEEAGAIRFSHILQERARKQQAKKNIVLALPIYPTIAMQLQQKLIETLKEVDFEKYSIKIKPHPYLPHEFIQVQKFKSYSNCEFVNTEIKELLTNSCLVITSGSTVAYEAVCSGIKTIYFLPEDVTDGNEYAIRQYLNIAYEYNFTDVFMQTLMSVDYPVVNKHDYFGDVNYEMFIKYIHEAE